MEEVEKTTKQLLEEKIQDCIRGLAYVEQGSEQHNSLVNDIQKLTSALTDLEKTEHSILDSDRKFAEEVREKDLELHYRDTLERDKLHEQRKSDVRDAIIKGSGIFFQMLFNVTIAGLAMKLEFLDNGAICSLAGKELVRKAFTTVKSA